MAIPCSNTYYGSSPPFLDFYPMDDIIKCGQDPYEFKADIFDEQDFSIEGYMGLDKCEYDLPASDILSDYGNAITNRDCMWSGTNTSSGFSPPVPSAMSGDNLMLHATAAAPFAAVTNSIASMSTTSNHTTSMASSSSATSGSSSSRSQHSTSPNSILASSLQPPALLMSSTQIKKEIKEEPSDDYEQQLQQHNIVRGTAARASSSMQNIPAGTSLLRKSNQQQQQRRQQQQYNSSSDNKWTTTKSCSIPIPATKSSSSSGSMTGSFLKSLTAGGPPTSMLTSSVRSYRRPDTPHSLDDELPELKHDIDLRACIDESAQYIHSMTQELQDTNKDQIETSCLGGPVSLNEVTEVIKGGHDYEEDDEEDEDYDEDEEDRHSSSCASMLEDGDSFGGNSRSSNAPRHTSAGNSSMHHHQQPYHSDHSYTRCKDGGIGRLDNLETPSETDEEIDVVTINDRKLPTNPSDFDRRAIQTKVAHKFSNERLIKSANGGVRTVAPRRRCSFLQYTPVSNNSPVKSVNNSRYPSPTHTPYIKYHNQQQQQQQDMLLDDLASDLLNVQQTTGEKGRKRMNGTMMSTTTKKQNRSKKMCLSAQTSMVSSASSTPSSGHSGQSSPTAGLKRHYSLDEADTIEKRNLHNDMERQRRIGLKNLFEALKKQIPSIREKERAPKVNILREAAKLCEQLTREDAALSRESEQLDKEMQRNRERIARLKAAIKLK